MIALQRSAGEFSMSVPRIDMASIRILQLRYNNYAQLVWRVGEQSGTKRLGVINLSSPTALLDVSIESVERLDINELRCLHRANKAARWK